MYLMLLPDIDFSPYKVLGTAQRFLGFHVTKILLIWLTRDLWIKTSNKFEFRPNFKCFSALNSKTLSINCKGHETATAE